MGRHSAGIRVSELAKVKVSDIDSKRMLIRIDQGKNRKDRYVRLFKKQPASINSELGLPTSGQIVKALPVS